MSNKKEAVVPAAPKPKTKTAAKEPVMYVGPTILGNLFIAIKDYPEANAMLREKRGYIHSAFNKALELKNGGKK